jgi:hypothetical protein
MSNLPAWIQAVAAVVQAVAAIVIYLVTRDYVRLTGRLAASASEQLRLQRLDRLADDKQRAMIVSARAKTVLQRLEHLPPDMQTSGADRTIREVALWSEGDVEAVHAASASLLGMASEAAAKASMTLTWLRDRVTEIRSVRPEIGFDYRRFPYDAWKANLADAQMALRELVAYGDMMQSVMDGFAQQIPRSDEA